MLRLKEKLGKRNGGYSESRIRCPLGVAEGKELKMPSLAYLQQWQGIPLMTKNQLRQGEKA